MYIFIRICIYSCIYFKCICNMVAHRNYTFSPPITDKNFCLRKHAEVLSSVIFVVARGLAFCMLPNFLDNNNNKFMRI